MNKTIIPFIIIIVLVSLSFSSVSYQTDMVTIGNPNNMSAGDLQNSSWLLYGHDAQNTCQSEYAAGQNEGYDKWKYFIADGVPYLIEPVIDNNGTLYTTSYYDGLYAIYPNGTLKWHSDLIGFTEYQPVIGQDGTIYVGTLDRFHAFYPNGTLKWVLPIEKNFCGTPVITPENIICTGTDDGYLYALYPNGTIQWAYYLGYRINGASLDKMGNIYFTARYCDYLYCLNPNGTLRWTFEIVQETSDAPLIGNDGTIYTVPIYDVIAINPDGTEKWRTPVDGAGGSPTLSPDGTIIYSSHDSGTVIGIDPDDGHVLWFYNVGLNPLHKTRAAISSDGMIFFAYTDESGSEAFLCALGPDGTLRWTTNITSDHLPYDVMSLSAAPSIGADGTVYITTWFCGHDPIYHDFGYVHAFGQRDPDAPAAPTIIGSSQGKVGAQYEFTVASSSPVGKDIYYYVLWGDDSCTNWTGPFHSGELLNVNHSWWQRGMYTVRARARDIDNRWGPWGTLKVTMPLAYESPHFRFLNWLFERFPHSFPILRHLTGH